MHIIALVICDWSQGGSAGTCCATTGQLSLHNRCLQTHPAPGTQEFTRSQLPQRALPTPAEWQDPALRGMRPIACRSSLHIFIYPAISGSIVVLPEE